MGHPWAVLYRSFDRSSRRTYPTKCSRCGAKVFFLEDENGGKVFLDRLGWPWPRHECGGRSLTSVGRAGKGRRRAAPEDSGLYPMTLLPPVRRADRADPKRRPRNRSRRSRNRRRRATQAPAQAPAVAIKPKPDAPGPPPAEHGLDPPARRVHPGKRSRSRRRVRGILRERSLFPDPVRELEIPDTPIGRGVMVMLDLDPLARITIHEREPGRSADSSFTAWIPRRRLVLRPISVGEPVHATLQSKSVGDQHVWFCEALSRPR